MTGSPDSFYSGPPPSDPFRSSSGVLLHGAFLDDNDDEEPEHAHAHAHGTVRASTISALAGDTLRSYGRSSASPTSGSGASAPEAFYARSSLAATSASRYSFSAFGVHGDGDGGARDSAGYASTKYSVDGGVRLAGGRPGSDEADVVPYGYSDANGSTARRVMPPPYGTHALSNGEA